jgi:hypothetical protein
VTGGSGLLDDLFAAKQEEMLTALQGVRKVVEHPVMRGDATEEHWRKFLRHYLPERYAVDTGKVIDSRGGESQQIDVIILDRQYSPLLFESNGQKYFPAESVYGVFEVKQELDKENLKYASDKAASVRSLHRTSAPIVHVGGEFEPREPFRIIGGVLTTESGWSPPFGDAFQSVLGDLEEGGRIDLGCAMAHGAFTINYDTRAGLGVGHHAAERSPVGFVFDLLAELQRPGTVPAIDYGEYLET